MAAKHKPPDKTSALSPGKRTLARVLIGIAILISCHLGWVSFSGSGAIGCGPESGCSEVLKSRWAYWFGVPVSLFGLAAYIGLLAATVRIAAGKPAPAQYQGWVMIWVCGILVLGGAIWFTGLQALVIKAFCPWCLTAHGAASVAALLLLSRTPFHPLNKSSKSKGKKETHSPSVFKPAMAMRLTLVALAGLAILAAGQVLHQPKTFAVTPTPGASTVETNVQTARILSLFDGRIRLNLDEVPLIGRRDAPHVMVGLHDYTCKGCRQMHHPLLELQRAFSNDLAIVSLPLPLDADCNPIVGQTPAAHVNACVYARLGLALWRIDPAVLARFNDWVFGPTQPPSVEETTAFAKLLVGEPTLQTALQDPWVEEQLRTSIQIFALNMQASGRTSMPQFVIGTNVVFGSMSMDELARHVTRQFGLSLPSASAATP